MKKILVRDYGALVNGAGYHIYNGYAKAWDYLGYKVERWTNLSNYKLEEYQVMMASGDIQNVSNVDKLLSFLERLQKIYMFVSPNSFPSPWGKHPNYVDTVSKNKEVVKRLNELDNIVFWSFCDTSLKPEFWEEWREVHYIPLAFDNLSYLPEGKDWSDSNYEYDVVYVGGWANNGFDSKKKIIKEYFASFKDSNLKCGFFINKNLTHEQECKLLSNAKVCINIHDDYQQILKLDTNERTWKALGLNGILVCDSVGSVIPNQPYTFQVGTPEEMVQTTKLIINELKDYNRKVTKDFINNHHTYIERCKELEKKGKNE